MDIAQTIYQHVKTMPMAKAVEVLNFIEFIENKQDFGETVQGVPPTEADFFKATDRERML